MDVEFIHVNQKLFWGFERIWVSSCHQINITDPERTALDLSARPAIFGGIPASIEILEYALGQIKVNRLIDYALKYDPGSVIKRLGWLWRNWECLGKILKDQQYPARRYYPLDPNLDADAPKNIRWQVLEKLRRS